MCQHFNPRRSIPLCAISFPVPPRRDMHPTFLADARTNPEDTAKAAHAAASRHLAADPRIAVGSLTPAARRPVRSRLAGSIGKILSALLLSLSQ